MKNKVYAISLLLSFLVVLGHEMIEHHHHDSMAVALLSSQNVVDSPNEKSNEGNSSDEHNHPLPYHNHSLATSDFINAGTNLNNSNSPIKISTLLVMSIIFRNDFSEPPCNTNYRYRSKQFIIFSFLYPEANALRGPPSIA